MSPFGVRRWKVRSRGIKKQWRPGFLHFFDSRLLIILIYLTLRWSNGMICSRLCVESAVKPHPTNQPYLAYVAFHSCYQEKTQYVLISFSAWCTCALIWTTVLSEFRWYNWNEWHSCIIHLSVCLRKELWGTSQGYACTCMCTCQAVKWICFCMKLHVGSAVLSY